jgi:hypothetical protein
MLHTLSICHTQARSHLILLAYFSMFEMIWSCTRSSRPAAMFRIASLSSLEPRMSTCVKVDDQVSVGSPSWRVRKSAEAHVIGCRGSAAGVERHRVVLDLVSDNLHLARVVQFTLRCHKDASACFLYPPLQIKLDSPSTRLHTSTPATASSQSRLPPQIPLHS